MIEDITTGGSSKSSANTNVRIFSYYMENYFSLMITRHLLL